MVLVLYDRNIIFDAASGSGRPQIILPRLVVTDPCNQIDITPYSQIFETEGGVIFYVVFHLVRELGIFRLSWRGKFSIYPGQIRKVLSVAS